MGNESVIREYQPPAGVRYLQANGLRFGYLEAGDGPLVLLLHGFPDTAATWDEIRPRLAGAGYRVVAPFLRGYAPSEIPPARKTTIRELGEDVLALIAALGQESAIVVGHDWGSAAAFAAAMLQPARVKKLITMTAPHPASVRPSFRLLWLGRHFVYLRRKGAARKMRRDDFAHVDVLCRRWSPTWPFTAEDLDPVKNAFSAPGCLDAALGFYRGLTARLPRDLRQPIVTDSLAFAGADDPFFTPAHYRRAARLYQAEYRIEVVPGGHFLHREHPAPVVDAIVDFLG